MPIDKPGNVYVAVVDDDENLCRSFARLLRAAGMQPITYLSAEAFLADTKHPQFDCLLLDIQLTGTSGLELQRQLAATGKAAPTIFITGHDDPEHARRSMRWAAQVTFGRRTLEATCSKPSAA